MLLYIALPALRIPDCPSRLLSCKYISTLEGKISTTVTSTARRFCALNVRLADEGSGRMLPWYGNHTSGLSVATLAVVCQADVRRLPSTDVMPGSMYMMSLALSG